MDLSEIVPHSDEIVVTLKYPNTDKVIENNGDKTPMTITLYAPHTKEYKAVVSEQANKRIKEGKQEFSIESFEEASVDLLTKITKSWNITFGGSKPKMSEKKAREVYTSKAGFWIVEQLQEGLNSFEAFTPA